ncbi:MAG: hypothetical protein H0T79_00745 [Deltaproteobacteria bacterium]|nr:hypothetical protein [Deltaproteobacteria bacterium]
MSERGVRMVAVGASLVAVAMAGIATVVVIKRSASVVSDTAVAGSGAAIVTAATPGLDVSVPVAATDFVKLRREVVTAVTTRGDTIGVRVTDPELRKQLGLLDGDVITALSGRALKREWDVIDAISGTTMLDPRTIFVEVSRQNTPVLVRWAIQGDLRAAQRAARADSMGTLRLPSVAPVADPLVATITRVDDTHFEMPRATADKLIGDPSHLKSARTYPSTILASPGFRIFALRPQTAIAALGLANGDVVRGLNGSTTPTMDRFIEVLGQMPAAATWSIEIERRRLPIMITITVK